MKNIALMILSLFIGYFVAYVVAEIIARPDNYLLINSTALISALMVPFLMFTYLFRKKKHVFLIELIVLALIGFIEQQATYASSYHYHGFFNEFLGYTLLLPFFAILMHRIIIVHHIYNKFSIIAISIGLSILVHFINFILYPMVGGKAEQMYFIALFESLPFAILFAVLYGAYLIKYIGLLKFSKVENSK
jgi:hypothetical protein